MLIKVINPNTTAAMTRLIGECARAVAGPGTIVEAVNPSMGPVSIESHYDEALSVPGLLEEIASGERAGADGYVVACFGDPGLPAARELATGPVVGIAEAAMHAATFLGRGFTVVTTLDRTCGRAWDLARQYGMHDHCRNVRASGIGVLELETDPDAHKILIEECRAAIDEDGADCIVLGCAGMANLCRDISAEIGAPVIDGVAAATLTVQMLITLGLRGRNGGEFAYPLPKPYVGLLADFVPPAVSRRSRSRSGPATVVRNSS